MPVKERDVSIDVLRCFAIIGIFIAHCTPNIFFIQLRGFDVILMVFLSGVCSSRYDRDSFNYFDYFVKRFVRLVIPVWIFLSVYFIGMYFFYYLPPIREIILSFSFLSDRYVWIIRILLILSLLSPCLYFLTNRLPSFWKAIGVMAMCLVCELIFIYNENKTVNLILMTIPYCFVYIVGMRINSFTKKGINRIAILSLCIFLIILYFYGVSYGKFIPTSELKYPPRIYYISYGIGMTLLIWANRQFIVKILRKSNFLNGAKYIGSHTYWLYLWHIPFVDAVGNDYNPMVRFSIIFVGSLSCVTFQNYMINNYMRNKKLAIIFKG